MSFSYLASAYTHADASVRQERYEEARTGLAWLLEKEQWAYSPIVHCHDLAINHKLPYTADFWEAYNRTMILASERIIVLNSSDAWLQSKGVRWEIELAIASKIPLGMLTALSDKRYHLTKEWNPEAYLARELR